MKILIGGDTVAGPRNRSIFEAGDAEGLIGSALREVIAQYDTFVVNLEVPLISRMTPIEKNGPCMGADVKAVKGYLAMGVNAVSLANNHIFDHGIQGLQTTLDVLRSNGIPFTGAGFTTEEAATCLSFSDDGYKISIYSCCENEFSTFSRNGAGANGFDFIETFDQIRACAAQCDCLIVLYHGGKEMYRYPTPMQQRIMRKMADCGAQAVIAQHSHCIGCEEEYHGAKLIYGQGNFLFDFSDNNELVNSGLLLGMDIDRSGFKIEKIPVLRNGHTVKLADEVAGREVLAGFVERSAQILQEGTVQRFFQSRVEQEKPYLLRQLHGDTFVVKVFAKLFPNAFVRLFYGGKPGLAAQNVLRCESHLESILYALDDVK